MGQIRIDGLSLYDRSVRIDFDPALVLIDLARLYKLELSPADEYASYKKLFAHAYLQENQLAMSREQIAGIFQLFQVKTSYRE
jgi:hypothetical protein